MTVLFKRLCLVLCALAYVSAFGQETKAPATPSPATLAELQQRLTNLVTQPRFDAALWGVKVASLDTGKTLFEHNPQKLFSPASNSKLYTVALALDRLGADYRIKTSLYAKAKPNDDGTLEGDLILYGRGDPTINARLHEGNIYKALEPLVFALTNAGVKRIHGDLVADESFFQGPPYGSGWVWEDLENYYGAEVSALTINDNTLQVSVRPGDCTNAPCKLALSPATAWLTFSNRTQTIAPGGQRSLNFYRPLNENVVYVTGRVPLGATVYADDLTVHNPAGLFGAFFQEALARHGLKLQGRVRTVNWLDRQVDPINCDALVELGAMESLPMRDIAREVQKPSQNLYTDLLLAHVGERTRSAETRPGRTSENLGLDELGRFLARAGVRKGDTIFEEGSGLSRNNVTTPNATVALLQYMSRHACADTYLAALPVAGVDGTLRSRMKNTPAAGKLKAKTGSLMWAYSLSGHVTSAAGERLVFSLMLNRYRNNDPAHAPRAELDAIAVMLAGFSGKSE